MADDPNSPAPAAEELQPQSTEASAPDAVASHISAPPSIPRRLRRGSYRPSHRATFMGLAVVVAILAINAAIVGFLLKSPNGSSEANQPAVTINQSALNKLGVNQTSVGNAGIELTVNPDAKFNGKLQVGGDVNIGGQLKLNSTLNAASADLTQLQAGNSSFTQINVNGDGTISNLALRKNLTVAGTSTLQGSTTFNSLITANGGLNVSGNLAVGGTLAVNSFSISNITVGHIISTGSTPSYTRGNVGTGGTVNMSGNDSAGIINANIGSTGCPCGGVLANVTFSRSYSAVPHITATLVNNNPGPGAGTVFVNRSSAGFSIGITGSVSGPQTISFDYIVEQ